MEGNFDLTLADVPGAPASSVTSARRIAGSGSWGFGVPLRPFRRGGAMIHLSVTSGGDNFVQDRRRISGQLYLSAAPQTDNELCTVDAAAICVGD
jgi:hypothetical protein